MTKRILALDGGGVRGVIPAVVLAALEGTLGGRVRDHFDFVAGTSSGALIGGAVLAGVPADEVVDLYRTRAPRVFRRVPVLSTLRRILTGHMYDVEELHRLVERELANHGAQGWRLQEINHDVMFTAKGLTDGHQWYFVKDSPGRNACSTGRLRLADCLTASAAAPTFFAPWTVRGLEHRGPMVDGGTGVAGNPVYQACVEAFDYADGYLPRDTLVVSLGTGQFLRRPRPTWLYSWLSWLLAELLRSPGEQQTQLVQRHYPTTTFYRIDVELPRDYGLDDARAIDALHHLGQQLAGEVDWPAILSGRDTRWLVTAERRLPPDYAVAL